MPILGKTGSAASRYVFPGKILARSGIGAVKVGADLLGGVAQLCLLDRFDGPSHPDHGRRQKGGEPKDLRPVLSQGLYYEGP